MTSDYIANGMIVSYLRRITASIKKLLQFINTFLLVIYVNIMFL